MESLGLSRGGVNQALFCIHGSLVNLFTCAGFLMRQWLFPWEKGSHPAFLLVCLAVDEQVLGGVEVLLRTLGPVE